MGEKTEKLAFDLSGWGVFHESEGPEVRSDGPLAYCPATSELLVEHKCESCEIVLAEVYRVRPVETAPQVLSEPDDFGGTSDDDIPF